LVWYFEKLLEDSDMTKWLTDFYESGWQILIFVFIVFVKMNFNKKTRYVFLN
jgi:hypothetical protein